MRNAHVEDVVSWKLETPWNSSSYNLKQTYWYYNPMINRKECVEND